MQSLAINDRVIGIKNNEIEINRLVEEYKPFIVSCTVKATGRYVKYGEDDELSIAMMGFVEAIKSYNKDKGNFLPFSQNVIKRRLIDYYRKEKKHNVVISLNEYIKEDNEEIDLSATKAIEIFSDDSIAEYRRLELEQLSKELAEFDISFFDLADISPKHNKTRKVCKDITAFLLSQPDCLKTIKIKRYLPIADIIKAIKIPRKIIERFRKYIIALIIIATGDYQYIRDYIDLDGRGSGK